MNDEKISNKGGFSGEPIEEIILEKNRKLKEGEYVLSSDRFELLVYLGLMPVFPHWKKTITQFFDKNKNSLDFDRIWIFQDDQENPRILWSYSKVKNCVENG